MLALSQRLATCPQILCSRAQGIQEPLKLLVPLQQALGLPHVLLEMQRLGSCREDGGQHHLTHCRPSGLPPSLPSKLLLPGGRSFPAAHPELHTARLSSSRKVSWLAQVAVKTSTSRPDLCNFNPSCSRCCLCSQAAFNSLPCWPGSLRVPAASRESGESKAAICAGPEPPAAAACPGRQAEGETLSAPLGNLPPLSPPWIIHLGALM